MTEFLQTALTFPTLIWSVLFAFCVVYWLLAAAGIVHHDHVHLDGADAQGFDIHHVHADGHADAHHHNDTADSVGLLQRLGLDGVPIMVMLALLTFWAWVVTYFVHLLVIAKLPEVTRALPGVLTLVGALIPAIFLTNLFLRPIRPMFQKLNAEDKRTVIGMVGTVSTPSVDERSGMASFDDDGAGLLLQVRTQAPERLVRGQKVVILQRNAADNAYLVTSEDRFNA